jgi:hypothetical protein
MVLTIVSTASAAPAELSPEMRAMVKQLAQREPTQSCAADPQTMSPASMMYTPGGAIGGFDITPQSVGGPGGLWVQCSLKFTNGASGGDCEGKHTIDWTVIGADANVKVTAELLALDTNGNLLKSFVVKQGESVQMNSRLSPSDWKFSSGKGTYDIFAPVPLLRVKVEEPNGDKTEAYCSNIPWVDVVQPSGGSVSQDSGKGIDFKAAVPQTDVTNPKFKLTVDGLNILPLIAAQHPGGLGIGACLYTSPCNGTLGTVPPITYSNFIVDVAQNVGMKAANTISGNINGLDCGGHYIRVTSGPNPGFRRTSLSCNLDDLNDRGFASVFAIKLTNLGGFTGAGLVNGLITTQIPTEVTGEVCSGTPILNANINGLDLPVGGQTTTPGSGDVGPLVKLDFDNFLNQTDLAADFGGTNPNLGTFAPGSNRLLIAATDQLGTRAYDRLIFAVGDNIKPLGISASAVIASDVAQAQLTQGLQQAIQAKFEQQLSLSPTETTIKNAFIVGLSAEGAQQILDNLCQKPIDNDNRTLRDIFADSVGQALGQWTTNHPLTTFNYDPPCSCDDDNVPVIVESFTVGDTFSCPIVFENGQMKVSLVLPDVTIKVSGSKNVSCFANHTDLYTWITAQLQNIHFDYTLTEADILHETTTEGANPFQVGGKIQLDAGIQTNVGVLGDICNAFVDAFVTLFTFGQVDVGPLLEPNIAFSDSIDLTEALSPAQPNAIPMKGFQIDQQTNGIYHQELSGDIDAVSDIHITGPDGDGKGAGITVGLKGHFATTSVDPSVINEGIPGYQAKEPALPTMRQLEDQGGEDALVGLSIDAINTLFQSLGSNGDMKVPGSDAQGCFPLNVTIGSLLPADCESIDTTPNTHDDDVANAGLRGYCHAIKGDNCATISFVGNPDPGTTATLTSGERGVCFGGGGLPAGKTCADVANGDLTLLLFCGITPNLNLHANQNVMFCAKADIPLMELPKTGPGVTSDLQINDISVSLVLDRGGPGGGGAPDNQVNGNLADLPGCFSGTQTTTDCNILSACLDVNMFFTMNALPKGNAVCENGKPGIQASFSDLLPNIRNIGEVCAGGTVSSNDSNVLAAASNSQTVTGPIGANAQHFAPPICGSGLETPLFSCDTVKVLGIDTAIDPNFKEFLAVTCQLH